MTVLRNPVLRGFAPDPSLVRVGDWYYVATSSFEWFPTIPIHRSRDLAHWSYAGHVRGAVPGDSLAGVPDSGGIWAPSMSWDGERFWMTYSVVRSVGTPYFDVSPASVRGADGHLGRSSAGPGEAGVPRRGVGGEEPAEPRPNRPRGIARPRGAGGTPLARFTPARRLPGHPPHNPRYPPMPLTHP